MLNKRLLKGVFFITVTYFTAFLGTLVVMGPTLILLWLRPGLFRWMNDRLIVWWLVLPTVRSLRYSSFVYFTFPAWFVNINIMFLEKLYSISFLALLNNSPQHHFVCILVIKLLQYFFLSWVCVAGCILNRAGSVR